MVDVEELDQEEYNYAFAPSSEEEEDRALITFGKDNVFLFQEGQKVIDLILDSGCTNHIFKDKGSFIRFVKRKTIKVIRVANKDEKSNIHVTHQGDVVLRNKYTGKMIRINNVLYSEQLPENLLSLSQLRKSLLFFIDGNTVFIIDRKTRELVLKAEFDGKFWRLNLDLVSRNNYEKFKNSKESKIFAYTNFDTLVNETGGSSRLENTGIVVGIGGSKRVLNEIDFDHDSDSKVLSKIDFDQNAGFPQEKRVRLSFDQDEDDTGINKQDLIQIDLDRTRKYKESEAILWHLRLNHASKSYLELAAKIIPDLKGIKFTDEIENCLDCKLGKAKRKPFKEKRKRATKALEIIHSDTMGKISPPAFKSGAEYIITFMDDYSRFALGYLMNSKTEAHIALKDFLLKVRNLVNEKNISKTTTIHRCNLRQEHKCKAGILHTDNGTEYKTSEMKRLLNEEKILWDPTFPYHPQHVGCSERLNLDIEQKVRTLILSAKMPESFWIYALEYIMYVRNRSPHSSINYQTPYKMVTGKDPKLRHIRRFGCVASVLINKKQNKFTPTGRPCFLIEVTDQGYKFLNTENFTVVPSKHASFIESKTYGDFKGKLKNISLETVEKEFSIQDPFKCNCPMNEGSPNNVINTNINNIENIEINEDTNDDENSQTEQTILRIEDNKQDEINDDNEQDETNDDNEQDESNNELVDCQELKVGDAFVLFMKAKHYEIFEPETYKQAVNCKDSKYWIDSMNDELTSLEKCKTWKIVPRNSIPSNASIVTPRWLFKVKNEAGNKIRRKSRIVARGFADTNVYDIDETYAPVAGLTDIKFLLAAANKFELPIHHLDVKTAFLNGKLDKKVYMKIPQGLKEYLNKQEAFEQEYILELEKSIYGLKVSPKRWNVRFDKAMKKMRFSSYPFQPCLYIWRNGTKFAIVLVYVDDIMMISNDELKMKEIKNKMKNEFETNDLGDVQKFLGMEIYRDTSKKLIILHQQSLTNKILHKFGMNDKVRNVSTPMLTNDAERKQELKENTDKYFNRIKVPYRQAIGSLLYLANCTRPDITYAVNVLSRRQENFDEQDWISVKRILRYLKGTIAYGIRFEGKEDGILCYPDASLGLNDREGKSTTGYAILLFGDIICWRTQKQRQVALSSAEAEFVAMSAACKDLANIREKTRAILRIDKTPLLLEDNRAAIKLAKTEESQTLRHLVNLYYHFVRAEVKSKHVNIEWICSQEQLGDFFTKALPRPQFEKFRDMIMIDLSLFQNTGTKRRLLDNDNNTTGNSKERKNN